MKEEYYLIKVIDYKAAETTGNSPEDAKLKILELSKQNYTLKQISEQIGFSQQAISKFLKYKII